MNNEHARRLALLAAGSDALGRPITPDETEAAAALDALALVEPMLHAGREDWGSKSTRKMTAVGILLAAHGDDVEPWQRVACVLAGWLCATLAPAGTRTSSP